MPGILTDASIAAAIEAGDIKIDPWNEKQLNPTSYDLTLGEEVGVYVPWTTNHASFDPDGTFNVHTSRVLDVREEPRVLKTKIDPQRGWVLKPGIGYLMHTVERISTTKYVPIVDGKSSIGRLFVQIHATAGYGDPGFDGQYTLEVIVQHPIRVYAGMRIGQIRFHTMEGTVNRLYTQTGHYQNVNACGAVGSQAFKQFKLRSKAE